MYRLVLRLVEYQIIYCHVHFHVDEHIVIEVMRNILLELHWIPKLEII